MRIPRWRSGPSGSIDGTPWAKLQPRGNPTSWHSLVDHSIDVAAVAEALMRLPTWEHRLTRLARRSSLDATTRARLVWLVGLHDMGKANHGFQAKRLGRAHVAGHIGEAIELLRSLGGSSPLSREARATLGLVPGQLLSWGAPEAVFGLLIAAVSHHGSPALHPSVGGVPRLWMPTADYSPLAALRELGRSLADGLPNAVGHAPPLPEEPGFAHAFAGLVMLADWVGSSPNFFPYRTDASEDRWAFARRQAELALAELGIRVPPALRTEHRVIDAALIGQHSLRPAQAQVASVPLPASEDGSVLVLEAATGAGKTEAAFVYFLRLFDAGLIDGLIFALPTRAAATQLHGRLHRLVRSIWGVDSPAVVLGVPGYLRVDDAEGRKLPDFEVQWPDSVDARGRTWAAEHPKRFLAAPILVGTVDQVLLSVLQRPHAHLRATSLLRQLVVVDEVHASDAYMGRIMAKVLEVHRGAGGHSLLMSATLAVSARHALLGQSNKQPRRRRRRGSSDQQLTLESACAEPYPMVVRSDATGLSHWPVTMAVVDKTVDVEGVAAMEVPSAVVDEVAAAAQRGARVLIIRNTVKGCLELQALLEATVSHRLLFQVNGQLTPHHARYAPDDRKRLDQALEERFSRPGGVVVCATQTVQQSLDIDADVMFTDLCPMDVLLQRMGRLHRHSNRARPKGFGAARCVVLTPNERDLSSLLRPSGEPRSLHGLGGEIYSDLRLIEATWRRIETGEAFRVPSANRELVENAQHPEVLASIGKDGPLWVAHSSFLAGKGAAGRGMANLSLVNWSCGFGDIDAEQRLAFPRDGARVPTRLGEMDRLLPLCAPWTTPFGATVTALKIPAWMVREADGDLEEGRVSPSPDGRSIIQSGHHRWLYGRWGLELPRMV